MSGNSLINLGDLSKPATVLIEKVSEAVGGIAKPWQMKRVAKAELEIEKLKAKSTIELTELQERGLKRLISEAEERQSNIEEITARAIPHLEEGAVPQGLDRDWLTAFFEKAKLVSDEDVQEFWAKILAEQANRPRAFSKKTLDIISSLDKPDAAAFSNLCSSVWDVGGPTVVILDVNAPGIEGVTFDQLSTLESLGLINIDSMGGFYRTGLTLKSVVFFSEIPVLIEATKDSSLPIGNVMLTRFGAELVPIVKAPPSRTCFEATLQYWINNGVPVSLPLLKTRPDWMTS